jgi:hypothetical protein
MGEMLLEMLNTIAAVGTFTVITATAVAALVQLRHLRRANQLAGLQSTFEMLQDPSVREIVNYVRHDLAQKMQDPAFREGLRTPAGVPVDRRDHPEYYLCDMYNHIGSFVRSDLIDESIYLQTEWVNVGLYWGLLRDAIAEGRKGKPHIFENFEWLAARAQRWVDEHPNGDYPPGDPRMIPSANDS